MFEKIKTGLKKSKEWVVEHKTDLAYFAGVGVGIVVTTAVRGYYDKECIKINKNIHPNLCNALSASAIANGAYIGAGKTGGPTVGELSADIINFGVNASDKVVGAIVFTQQNKI